MKIKFDSEGNIDEILYIYRQLKKIYMKGGNKNDAEAYINKLKNKMQLKRKRK